MRQSPAAFMSYARFDDEHDNGSISQLRARLSAEVRVQMGYEFVIFQDRADIKWGEAWKDRIDTAINATTFFIPILTPNFLRSDACREELEKFLDREAKLGRTDLILPIYYIRCATIDDPNLLKTDPLAQAIIRHQWADWRDLRFEPFSAGAVRRQIAALADQIRDALAREMDKTQPARSAQSASHRAPVAAVSTLRAGPRKHVVDAMDRGDFTTISEALANARAGDEIEVRPGLYEESIVLDKQVSIVGTGAGEVVIQATGCPVITFKATMGTVAKFTLRRLGGGEDTNSAVVEVLQGRCVLSNCIIESRGSNCAGVWLRGTSDSKLTSNDVRRLQGTGIILTNMSHALLADNQVRYNLGNGVYINDEARGILRNNQIYDNGGFGIRIGPKTGAECSSNHVTRNRAGDHGVEGANPRHDLLINDNLD